MEESWRTVLQKRISKEPPKKDKKNQKSEYKAKTKPTKPNLMHIPWCQKTWKSGWEQEKQSTGENQQRT